jgi:hypothetical protein
MNGDELRSFESTYYGDSVEEDITKTSAAARWRSSTGHWVVVHAFKGMGGSPAAARWNTCRGIDRSTPQ